MKKNLSKTSCLNALTLFLLASVFISSTQASAAKRMAAPRAPSPPAHLRLAPTKTPTIAAPPAHLLRSSLSLPSGLGGSIHPGSVRTSGTGRIVASEKSASTAQPRMTESTASTTRASARDSSSSSLGRPQSLYAASSKPARGLASLTDKKQGTAFGGSSAGSGSAERIGSVRPRDGNSKPPPIRRLGATTSENVEMFKRKDPAIKKALDRNTQFMGASPSSSGSVPGHPS